ncbi:DUF1761 domain-containing protein [Glycomyces terrestris]|uniref:DUF1761 domain-containing protein n=1 Tax=Glycomyces terrestris TaxID=2493553 RepID=A0A426UVD8_9ACTN|nr:DUF1761 domain-containing protein [Glycomyces terrestris]RRR98161.1 DUF1761 domain-containing protein [Glycomyces terrestris]
MDIDWLGAALALAVGMIVAGVWYGKAFLDLWARLTGIAPADSKRASRRNMAQLLVANAVTALGLAVGTAVAEEAVGGGPVGTALLVGVVAWLAFSASTLLQHNAFELKPAKLTVLNSAYQLVLFLAMALVIGLV